MQEIRVTAEGTPVCTKCGRNDFTYATTGAGRMTGGFSAPKRLICTACGTAHGLRKIGPYSEESPPAELPAASEPTGYYEIDPVGIGLAIVGAAIMVIAVFLPRLESSTFTTIAQNTLIQGGDGIWIVFAAIGVAGATYRSWKSGQRSWSVIVIGLIVVGLAYYEATSKDQTTLYPVTGDGTGGAGEKANAAIGIYAAGVGGILAAVGGWRMRSDSEWVLEDEDDDDNQQPDAATPAGPPDDLDRLERLADLHKQGALTDDEFAAQKARLLGT